MKIDIYKNARSMRSLPRRYRIENKNLAFSDTFNATTYRNTTSMIKYAHMLPRVLTFS